MDSNLISHSDEDCIDHHEVMECTNFDIVEVNTINPDQAETSKEVNLYHSLPEPSKPEIKEKDNEDKDTEQITIWKEMKIMVKLAIPSSLTSIARMVTWTTDQIFLGHLGTKQLAGASLADCVMEILTLFSYTPAWSLNGLCSQALGSGNKIMAGYWLQLTVIVTTIIIMPVSVGCFYGIIPLINIFSDDEDVIKYTKIFSHFALAYVFTNALLTAIRSYHSALEVVAPFTIISTLAICSNIIGNQLWIYGLHTPWFTLEGLGFVGSPLATSTSILLQLIVCYLWCFKVKKYHLKHKVWSGWSLKQTILHSKRVKEYFKVILPIIISNASENWGYQVVILYAATLDAAEIAAMSCTFAVWGILWSFYSGFGAAIVTRVGKQIGAGDVAKAKLVAKVGLILTMITCVTVAFCIFLMRHKVARMYSDDPEVHELMQQSLKIVCFTYVFWGIGFCATNVLEAMSRNKAKGIINCVSAWLGYVPACVYFMSGDNHKILHVSPVACIFVVGIVVEICRTITLWLVVFCTDWNKACQEAQERNDTYHDLVEDKKDLNEIDNDSTLQISDDSNALHCELLHSSQIQAASAV